MTFLLRGGFSHFELFDQNVLANPLQLEVFVLQLLGLSIATTMAAMVDQDFRHWSSTAAAADVTRKGLVVQTLSPDLDSGNKKTRNFVPLKVVGARVSQKSISIF